jgi:glutathione S-transferase
LRVHEVDLSNKSEEFLSVSPYEKIPVLSVNGTSSYESHIVNEYLDEVYESPKLMLEHPEDRHRCDLGWPLMVDVWLDDVAVLHLDSQSRAGRRAPYEQRGISWLRLGIVLRRAVLILRSLCPNRHIVPLNSKEGVPHRL